MSNPFTAPSISGYNSNPPSDDASVQASNQLQWSKHINKIGDPLKNYVDDVVTNVTAAFAKRIFNSVSGKTSDYTVVAATDDGVLFVFTGSGNNTLTLPTAASATADFTIGFLNLSTGTLTIDGDGSETVNAAATVVVPPSGFGGVLKCTGTAWYATGVAKTFDLTTVSLTGTLAQFNTALSDGSFVSLAGTETLTNKTLTAPVIATISNTGTLTLPTSTDTLVGRATTDTLTNKTLTSPTINGGTFTGGTDIAVADGGTGASTAAAARTNLGFASGEYTPTFTNDTNISASTPSTFHYLAIGDRVIVFGQGDVTPTSGSATTRLRISLPSGLTSNFTAVDDCSGVMGNPTALEEGGATADTTNDDALFTWISVDTTNRTRMFSFSYIVQ